MLNVSVVCDVEFCSFFQLRNVQILGFLLLFVSLPWVPKRDLGKETTELILILHLKVMYRNIHMPL